MKYLSLLLLAAIFMSGCATRTIKMPDGTTVTSKTLFVNSGLDKLDIKDSKAKGSSFNANGFKGDENTANDTLLQIVLALAARAPLPAPTPAPAAAAPLIVPEPQAVLPPPTTTVTTTPALVETRVTVTPTK